MTIIHRIPRELDQLQIDPELCSTSTPLSLQAQDGETKRKCADFRNVVVQLKEEDIIIACLQPIAEKRVWMASEKVNSALARLERKCHFKFLLYFMFKFLLYYLLLDQPDIVNFTVSGPPGFLGYGSSFNHNNCETNSPTSNI